MVGIFINTLPLRVCVNPDSELIPWLKDLRGNGRRWAIMSTHRWCRYRVGVTCRRAVRYSTASWCLRTSIWIRKCGGRGGPWSNRQFRLLDKTNFAITLVAYAEPELHFKIDFDTGRFDDATIERMLGHLRTLLESMANDPQARLGDLPLLTSAERQQLIVEWADTAAEYPCEKCLHQLFEEQAERTPDAVAVSFDGQHLSYRDLNARANELARYLRMLGVCAETLVAICIERSVEMVVGILGILKGRRGVRPARSGLSQRPHCIHH